MFRTKLLVRNFGAILGSALLGLMCANSVDAANPQNVTVEVTFVTAIGIAAPTNQLQFGLLDAAMPVTNTITIAPDNSVSGDTGNIIGGTQGSADLTVTAETGLSINILVTPVAAGTHYTLAGWMCSYDGGGDTVCDGGGMNTTSVASGVLRVGVTLTALGGAAAGNDDGNFNVTINYL